MKLVRDKVRSKKGRKYINLDEDDPRFFVLLCLKLNEEILEVQTEVLHHVPDRAHLIEEMADVIEVLRTIADGWGIEMEQVEEVREKKFVEKGGFIHGKVIV